MTVHVRQASGSPTFEGDADSADMVPGDLVYWKDADDEYALAEADDHLKPAQFIVVAGGSSIQTDFNDRVRVTKKAELYDDAAGFTENAPQYLSETPGEYTESRPTTPASLRQKVGEAITTSRAIFQINMTQEVSVPIVVMGTNQTEDILALDSGAFYGKQLDAQNELLSLIAILPENFLKVIKGSLYSSVEATSGTPTYDVTIGSAIAGAQHDVVTAVTLSAVAAEGTAEDEMTEVDLAPSSSTGLNGTDISRPGAILGFKVLSEDSGTDIRFPFGGVIICEVAA